MVGGFDRVVLCETTTAVLFVAVYPFLFLGQRSSLWFFGAGRRITLNDFLTIMLSLEAFLLVWLWRGIHRRGKTESPPKKNKSLERPGITPTGRIIKICRAEMG